MPRPLPLDMSATPESHGCLVSALMAVGYTFKGRAGQCETDPKAI